MAIIKVNIEEFMTLSLRFLTLDVRSPSEFDHAHIPIALNLPLFTDEQRVIVGTAYKQKSKKEAIKFGLDFFGPEMRSMVEKVEAMIDSKNTDQQTVLVHCWRGGMRSGAVAWLLDLYGFTVYLLSGGYKSYRNFVLKTFEIPREINIIGGYTGSGKTKLLHVLKNEHNTIDLEKLANHKGSSLGAIGENAQPSQEMFENLINQDLISFDPLPIFIEDESQRIGDIKIPDIFYAQMRKSKIVFLDIPFEKRLDFLCTEYGIHPKDLLISSILRIQKRLGGMETKNAIHFLENNNIRSCFSILLSYYDRWYLSGLYKREDAENLICKIESSFLDVTVNSNLILNAFKSN
jgi:tRNA 2-selenouridine synthase